MTKFILTTDINGNDTYVLPFCDLKYSTSLVATVEQTLTIPSDANVYIVIFFIEAGSEVWIAKNATAALPGGSFAATTSSLCPSARATVVPGDVLHFISGIDCNIGVELYAL
jgi:hypothetical protein